MEVFIDQDGREYGIEDIVETLKKVGADDCEHLFLHFMDITVRRSRRSGVA